MSAALRSDHIRGDAHDLELTILMPCLNEAETLETCIRKATGYLRRSGVVGEVLIADNGSSDGSIGIGSSGLGARVVNVRERGYGAALIAGIEAARGRYVIMGDADDSYEFSDLDGFVSALRAGNDLVMGNRFKGGIKPGAMPPLHRYLGNPVLSTIGRVFFNSPVGDFHCGLRGFIGKRSRARPVQPRYGIRERDGRQGDAAEAEDHRSADDVVAGRALATAAPAQLARWLASSTFPHVVQSALAVLVSRHCPFLAWSCVHGVACCPARARSAVSLSTSTRWRLPAQRRSAAFNRRFSRCSPPCSRRTWVSCRHRNWRVASRVLPRSSLAWCSAACCSCWVWCGRIRRWHLGARFLRYARSHDVDAHRASCGDGFGIGRTVRVL